MSVFLRLTHVTNLQTMPLLYYPIFISSFNSKSLPKFSNRSLQKKSTFLASCDATHVISLCLLSNHCMLHTAQGSMRDSKEVPQKFSFIIHPSVHSFKYICRIPPDSWHCSRCQDTADKCPAHGGLMS